MHTLVKQLEVLANKLGVQIHTNTDVRRILVDTSGTRKKIEGIEYISIQNFTSQNLSSEPKQLVSTKFYCNKVVSNSDAYETYQHLLSSRFVQNYSYYKPVLRAFMFRFCFVTKRDRRYDQLKHHNIFLVKITSRNSMIFSIGRNCPITQPSIATALFRSG